MAEYVGRHRKPQPVREVPAASPDRSPGEVLASYLDWRDEAKATAELAA